MKKIVALVASSLLVFTLVGCGTAQESDNNIEELEQEESSEVQSGNRMHEILQIDEFLHTDEVQNMVNSFFLEPDIKQAAKDIDVEAISKFKEEVEGYYGAIIHMDYPEVAYDYYYSIGSIGDSYTSFVQSYYLGVVKASEGDPESAVEKIKNGNSYLDEAIEKMNAFTQQIQDLKTEGESYL